MKFLLVFLAACSVLFCADFQTGQAARLVVGQPTFTAQTVPVTPSNILVGGVGGVAFANGNLFVADSNKFGATPLNNRVLLFTPVSQFPAQAAVPGKGATGPDCTVCVGTAEVVLGQTDFTLNVQGLAANGLRSPSGVASDGKILAVADTDNNRVLIWNSIPTSNGQPADVVVGQADFTHGASVNPPNPKSMRGPQGVWIVNGRLLVADTSNNRVLIFNSIPTSNGAAADLVLGQPDLNTLTPAPVTQLIVPATQSNISSPTSVTSDGTRVYVADLGHHRVLIWNTIPTANNQNSDVVIGQPDFVSEVSNNSPALCPSNGTDTTVTPNVPTYPALCGKTLSFPRFVLSDGQRLYLADGGNDRVLVYNSIPTANSAAADVILGEPDENTDAFTSGSDGMQTPSSLAWDGTNLYVADTYNLRILVFTPSGSQLPVASIRNAASLETFATGSVTFAGTPVEKDEVDLTIGTVVYKYTVVKNDTLSSVITGLVVQINSGTTPDPNVIALADTVNPTIDLTARSAGLAGEGTVLSVTTSTGSGVTATVSGATIAINLADASKIAPGTLITLTGTNLSDQTAVADFTGKNLPTNLGNTFLFIDGLSAPLLYVSPTQINAQMPYEVFNRTSVSIYALTTHADGSVTATNAVGATIVPENPGLFTLGGMDPRPGILYHFSANATGLLSIDGTITAGDTATITINGRTYTYTVLSTDTLTTIRDAFVALLANDPDVTATPSNLFTRIFLQARAAGTAGNGITYSATVSTGASITATALTTTLCCGNAEGGMVTGSNPAAPGEVVIAYATGLGITDPNDGSLTGRIVNNIPIEPLKVPVDSILAGGKTGNVISVQLAPGSVGVYQVLFQLDATLPTDPLTQLTIAQDIYVSNSVTFAVTAP